MADGSGPVEQAGEVSIDAKAARPRPTRKQMLTWLGGGVAVIAVLMTLQYVFIGSHFESTEDAYVGAATSRLSAQVSGVIAEVPVHETLAVKQGDVLAVIDPADAKLAAERADADYRRALQRVRQYYAEVGVAGAQVAARQADLDRAQTDFERREALSKTGAVSGEEMTSARAARDAARSNLIAAQQQLTSQRALIAGSKVEDNPEVLAAKAALDSAQLDLKRTTILAPVSGVVVQNSAQVGQRVAPGTPLMAVAPIGTAYVDANFKEGQLRRMKVGQPVELESDIYGGSVKYHGKVTGIGGGTGSAFAVIPAQNATGNWIKVIQRVPVRIEIDPAELAKQPLRVGMSMHATVDISK